jgi:hypothetical protein
MSAQTPTEVEVRRSAAGEMRPIRFTWEGAILDITGYGRRWSDEEGDHWLVMADRPERAFTLHRAPDGSWTVSASGQPRTVV